MNVVSTDERGANGAGRRRRRGAHAFPGTLMRLHPDVARELELEASSTGKSKVGIVEELLRHRYRLRASS